MMRPRFGESILIVFLAAVSILTPGGALFGELLQSGLGLLNVCQIEAESRVAWISSERGRPFNPLSLNSWLSIPSQFMQYWFPLFQPAYYPSHLQKPATLRPPSGNQSQSEKGKENIFGVSGTGGDSVEYLPPGGEIEW